MNRIYLDYAATTPVHPEVVRAILPYFTEAYGNPSSIHACGQEAKGAIEESRGKIARLIGAQDEEIVFTSSGTESDNYAVKGVAFANKSKGDHIITSSVEHHAVLESANFLGTMGFNVTYLPVDRYGMVDPGEVKKAITGKTTLISIMHANNEVGTIQPIAEIGKIAREAGVYFHTDAVQTAGHFPVDVNDLGVDLLSISAHKLYGPKGVGALFVRKGTRLLSSMHGGGQERGRRASTENVPGIVGLGKAAEIAREEMGEEIERLSYLRDRLIKTLLESIEFTRLNGHPRNRLPNNVNIGIDFAEGEAMCLNLDLEDICVSTVSACSSSNLEASHVLLAMGIPHEQAHSSLRFSMGKWTTEQDIIRVVEVLPKIVARLRAISPLWKASK